MEKIRLGNDIKIRWAIYTEAEQEVSPYLLEGRKLSLYLKNYDERKKVKSFSVSENLLDFTFYGKDQKEIGVYSLELVENEGLVDMHTVDECKAFALVEHTCHTSLDQDDNDNVECVHLNFKATVGVGYPTSSQIVVDNVLSETSENPVQNKVITSTIKTLQSTVANINDTIEELSKGYTWTDVQ